MGAFETSRSPDQDLNASRVIIPVLTSASTVNIPYGGSLDANMLFRRVQNSALDAISRPTASKIGQFDKTFKGGKPVKPTASTGFMERAMGIEPTSEDWGNSVQNVR